MNQTAKAAAVKIAKQLAQEPLEILKTAREQITGEEIIPANVGQAQTNEGDHLQTENLKLKQEVQSQRMLGALNQELRDIQRQNLFKDLQMRIARGEEVYLEDQNELTSEQREVLKAHQEAVQKQKIAAQQSQSSTPVFGSSKPSRKMGGQKQQAQKEQTRVEKPVPPSG